MGFRDRFFGRTAQRPPSTDNLAQIETAAPTFLSELDLLPSGQAGICLKPAPAPNGSGGDSLEASIDIPAGFQSAIDDLGFTWLIATNENFGELVQRVGALCEQVIQGESANRLLCVVFGFVPRVLPGEGAVRMVFLPRRGTWYPFAPTSGSDRNSELELRTKSLVRCSLQIESDFAHWQALWDLPVS